MRQFRRRANFAVSPLIHEIWLNFQKNPTTVNTEQAHKPKPLSSSNQQQQQHSNNGTGRRRNLNSPRPHVTRNRSWYGQFNMSFPHPVNGQWYGVMPPHFLGGPSPPPFMGHRGNKWLHPSSYTAGFTRFHHWSQKTTLKV